MLKDNKEEILQPIHDVVGQIRFLADRCRPDIGFAASFLARFSNGATSSQVKACNRVWTYLEHTKEMGIRVGSRDKEIKLFAYADASFATEDDSKSQLCYSLFLTKDSGTCLFKSWKDKLVTTSSTHSEVHALLEAVKTIIWYRELLKELGYEQMEPTVIYQDNLNVVNISEFSSKDNMTKFLISKINFIREATADNAIRLLPCKTEKMISDIGTKSMDYNGHKTLLEPLLHGPEIIEYDQWKELVQSKIAEEKSSKIYGGVLKSND